MIHIIKMCFVGISWNKYIKHDFFKQNVSSFPHFFIENLLGYDLDEWTHHAQLCKACAMIMAISCKIYATLTFHSDITLCRDVFGTVTSLSLMFNQHWSEGLCSIRSCAVIWEVNQVGFLSYKLQWNFKLDWNTFTYIFSYQFDKS